jgi:hypothetical protein
MRKRFIIAGCIVGSAFILAVVLFKLSHSDGRPYSPLPVAVYQDSSELGRTVVVPTMDAKILKGKNVIWCASFQLAWNHLGTDVLHEPPAIANADALVAQLNGSKFSETDLPSDHCYATAGYCDDGVVNTIHEEMQKRFHRRPKIDLADPANVIVAYAYLEASVPFPIPFFENEEPLVFHDPKGRQTNVTSFGIWAKHEYAYYSLRKQIEVLYSSEWFPETHGKAASEFVIDPCKDSSPNQIVLARVTPKDTPSATLDYIAQLVANKPDRYSSGTFGPRDVLLIPDMAWEITHHFGELEGKDKRLLNKRGKGAYIDAALQTIRFRLDRSGAELSSEAPALCKPKESLYVFDQPFVVYIKKRNGTAPFFAMYVDNAELLCTPETRAATGTR